MERHRDVLQGIGRTPLLTLCNIVPENGSRIQLKLESQNPTGSMKDRMALAMIEAAEADGRLRPGGSVVEYTGTLSPRMRSLGKSSIIWSCSGLDWRSCRATAGA